jgi:hypothetical protein
MLSMYLHTQAYEYNGSPNRCPACGDGTSDAWGIDGCCAIDVMNERHVNVLQELLDKCNPLGMFDSIATLAVASNMKELFRLVLVDTPLAPYFSESLSAGRGFKSYPLSSE